MFRHNCGIVSWSDVGLYWYFTDSEIHREAMQKDHDAAAEALRLAEEARDAAVAELEEAKEELMREKEVVKRWHAGFPDIRVVANISVVILRTRGGMRFLLLGCE